MSINKELPEYKLELVPSDEKAKKDRVFNEYSPEDLGKRFKIGGNPDFIQEEDYPNCPCCREKMCFYAQLDAIGDEYSIGDCGLIYVFFCFDCGKAEAVAVAHSY